MNTDKRGLSITAFTLFLCGVFVPFLLGFSEVVGVFAIVATVLALILGFLGRSFLLGKVAAIGALIICIVSMANYIRFCSDREAARRAGEARLRAEQETKQQAIESKQH